MKFSISLLLGFGVCGCEPGFWIYPAVSWSIWRFCLSTVLLRLYPYADLLDYLVYSIIPIFSSASPLWNRSTINHSKTSNILNTSFCFSCITELLRLSSKSWSRLWMFLNSYVAMGFEELNAFWDFLWF